MLDAAILIVVHEHAALILPLTVHADALEIAAGPFVRIAHDVRHVQAGIVFPNHASIGPQVAFFAVGVGIFYAVDADRPGQQARDKMQLIDVMAADVGKHVGIFRGAPVLEIGVAIVIGLVHFRMADPKFAELTFPIEPAGHQGPVIEPLMIFHAHNESLFKRDLFDLNRLGIFQYERFDTTDMLIGGKGGLYHRIMNLVRHGRDHNAPFRHLPDDFFEQIGKILLRIGIQRRIRREAVAGERLLERFVLS